MLPAWNPSKVSTAARRGGVVLCTPMTNASIRQKHRLTLIEIWGYIYEKNIQKSDRKLFENPHTPSYVCLIMFCIYDLKLVRINCEVDFSKLRKKISLRSTFFEKKFFHQFLDFFMQVLGLSSNIFDEHSPEKKLVSTPGKRDFLRQI